MGYPVGSDGICHEIFSILWDIAWIPVGYSIDTHGIMVYSKYVREV